MLHRLAALLLVGLATACSAVTGGSGKAEERTAQELADRLFPGQLTVIGSKSLFPRSSGSMVTFSVNDDPDAAVRLDVGSIVVLSQDE